MNFGEVIFLGALQGITEFFPISSSGHLLLAEHFFSLPVENLKAFDVVLHAGTLLALLVLFWREWSGIVAGYWSLVTGSDNKEKAWSRRLFWQLVLATIPAAVVGLLWGDAIDLLTRGENRVAIVSTFFVAVALLLFFAEKFGTQKNQKAGWKNVIWMGIFQATALLPGISRSGATIAAGMFSGLTRSAAARFSFLMLAPATAGAVALITKKVLDGELSLPPLQFTLVGFAVSAIVSFAAATFLLSFVKKHSLKVFSVYLILAAIVLLFIG
ncbi:MAG: undecaprenyl-diphosphate phosphatase [Candidatus Peribacteraceae bacterium]|nr:undecaprenyl-diphosphate phosphatase [Candidatus Peribacteraceae bacterium]